MRLSLIVCAIAAVTVAGAPGASAVTLTEGLSAAYSNNPTLNAARSRLRGIDEQISIARSGNRPNLAAAFSQRAEVQRVIGAGGNGNRRSHETPTTISLQLTQPLFQGFRVRNSIRQAEAAVRAERAALDNTEQGVLLDTATAFFDVIQNREIVGLRRNDVNFLGQQVQAANDRFEVGEGTRTDVSQAEARQARARSSLNFAEAALAASEATFFQLTGLRPGNLRDNLNEEALLPPSLEAAVDIGQRGHPAIFARLHDVDTAIFNVKVAEGQFLPSVNLVGDASTSYNVGPNANEVNNASIGLNVSIPIYQQGRVSAEVRQAKEQLGTARINVDLTRDQVRQNTVAAWAAYTSSVRTIFASQTGVFSAQLALTGVIEEQRVGQRTTLDVLDAQGELIIAQITLATAERDRNVAAFSLVSAIGRLSARRLGLSVHYYDPTEHADAIRDKWIGLRLPRTPDGR